jgi:hypothetical protein
MDLAAIETDVAQLQHLGRLSQEQDLYKQPFDPAKKVL